MSNFKLVSSETKPLDKALAESFKAMTPSPTERDLDPNRVKHLAGKAEDGLLTPFSWSTVNYKGKVYRMNGQHSSNMLAGLNGEFPEGLLVHLDQYEVEEADNMASLFRQFDDRKSSRSAADVSSAYQGLYPELAEIKKPLAKMSVEGVTWFNRAIEGLATKTGDDRYEIFNVVGLYGFFHYIGATISIKTPELKNVTTVAAMYATFIANETESREFWDHVARGGVEFEDDDPTTILSDWLLESRVAKNGKKPKAGEFYNACIYAWNAHREGRKLSRINIGKLKGNLTAAN